MVTATKAVNDAIWFIEKDKRYFLREFAIVEGLKKDLKVASNLHKLAKERDSAGMLDVVQSDLNSLESQERWQQLRARYPRLKAALKELLSLPVLSEAQRKKVRDLLPQLEVWEGNLLTDTVKKLDPLIRDKIPDQVNWPAVEKVVSDLERDLRALVAVDGQLKDAVGI